MHTAVCMRGLPLWAQNEAYNVGREKEGGGSQPPVERTGDGAGHWRAVRGGFGTGIYVIDDFNGKTFVRVGTTVLTFVTGGRS